ncbi:hypothetical protein L596_015009 [Steinernema carpocapsae]|uniref:Uncharacterized protein n=1 Tax=Steinernema carpocapsae TaxID=34508 RepID=A0A4U5NEY3_STECR|nr:hypothetical protein L596_015009 [Steinernema carpocapsae]
MVDFHSVQKSTSFADTNESLKFGGGDSENGTSSIHPLEYPYVFSYFSKPKTNFEPEDYAQYVTQLAVVQSVEQFWAVYQHLQRPHEIPGKVDFHLFKVGIQPVWEHERNCNGGKWILRLRKGLASRIWENLMLAMIGEQFNVGNEICGAVCSVRNTEDIISIWNRSGTDNEKIMRIQNVLRRCLSLPGNVVLEYKKHNDCLKDQSSYRHAKNFA